MWRNMYGSVQDFRKLCKNITWKKEVKKKKKTYIQVYYELKRRNSRLKEWLYISSTSYWPMHCTLHGFILKFPFVINSWYYHCDEWNP